MAKKKTNKTTEKPARFEKLKRFKDFLLSSKFKRLIGLGFILLSAYHLVAFTSFLFTWKKDQDKLWSSWSGLLFDQSVSVDNWLGKVGAIVSHLFIHSSFGIASFVFVLLFFLVGFKILTGISLLPLKKTFKISAFGVVWMSLVLGYIFDERWLFLGGAFGFQSNNWFELSIGKVGGGLLLFFGTLAFAVVQFDLSYRKLVNFFNRDADRIEDDEAVDSASKENDGAETEGLKNIKSDTLNQALEEDASDEPVLNEIFYDSDSKNTTEESDTAAELEVETEIEETSKVDQEDAIELSNKSTTPPPSENAASQDGDDGSLGMDVEVAKDDTLSDDQLKNTEEAFELYDPKKDLSNYKLPSLDLLEQHGEGKIQVDKEELELNKNKIVETLGHYNIKISKIKATIGPTVTLYEIVPAPGVKISKIRNLEDDIALSLAALGIRIIAPIPGRGTIGIEVPNQKADIVSMRSVIASDKFQNSDMDLPLAIGKTISNETFVTDLTKMPHLLMAGATGQGKSVGLNAILVSILYKKHPSQVKFVLVDPKKVELTLFNKIEKHFLAKLPDEEEAIITDTGKVVNTLNSLCIEMDDRYELLKKAHCRNLKEYNKKFINRKLNPRNGHRYMPYIVLVVDEFADLIMTAGKEVEQPIARLAQLARAIGIHLIIATQRPSVNIITGTIKANFPTRIAFRVTSKIDSRTILDAGGADQLIGRGDMLISDGKEITRLQCAFVDTPEVEEIVDSIGDQQAYPTAFDLPEYVPEGSGDGGSIDDDDRDELFVDAARIIVMHQQGSASLLQRKLKLGYNRAGRIVDQLEAANIIGPSKGSKAREVLYPDEMALEQYLRDQALID